MISQRLRELRDALGYTKRELVSHLPLNYTTYANYESGERMPNSEILMTLANFHNVSVDFLMGLTDSRKRIDDVQKVTDSEYRHICMYRSLDDHGKRLVDFVMKSESERRRIPPGCRQEHVGLQVFNQHASAGLGNYLDDYSDSDYELKRFVADSISTKADFAVRLQGDSMEPKYKDGDIVCVKSAPRVDPEQIGIFVYENEAFCKRLKIDRRKGLVYLESLNKNYEPILISRSGQLITVGMVLGAATPVHPQS